MVKCKECNKDMKSEICSINEYGDPVCDECHPTLYEY